MNEAQREIVAKGLADIGKGLFIAAPIAIGTGKLSPWYGLALLAIAAAIFNLGVSIAGGSDDGPT